MNVYQPNDIDGTCETRANPFTFIVRDGEPLTLDEAIYQALGAASVCWESLEGTGVFQDQRARKICEALLDVIHHTPAVYVESPDGMVKAADETSTRDELWTDLVATREHYAALLAKITEPAIRATLGAADCNCEPGDGTCKDWRDRMHRHEYLAAAVAWKIGTSGLSSQVAPGNF